MDAGTWPASVASRYLSVHLLLQLLVLVFLALPLHLLNQASAPPRLSSTRPLKRPVDASKANLLAATTTEENLEEF